jgi:hypothetical protein
MRIRSRYVDLDSSTPAHKVLYIKLNGGKEQGKRKRK